MLQILVIVLMVGLIVSACSSNNTGTNNTSSSNTSSKNGEESKSTSNSEEKVKLVVWIWDAAQKSLETGLDAFYAKYPNIEIEFQTMETGDVYQKYLIAANTGDAVPDIISLETSNLAQMVNIDSLLDITDWVAPYKDKMNSFKWADATKDDKIYAMPHDSGPVVMFYQKDIFEAAGLPTEPEEVTKRVQTFEDYQEIGKIIFDKTDAFLLSDSQTASNNRFFETMMWQRGLWYFDENGDVQLDSPEVKEVGQYIVDLTNNGYVFDAEPWGESWINAIGSGKVATIVGASWFDGLLSGWLDVEGVGKWGVVSMPKWSANDKYSSANDGGSNLAINKNSKHPEAAWKYIEFMLGNEDNQVKMMSKGIFPALETTYDRSEYSEPVEYFGGQPVREMFVEAVQNIYPQSYTEDFPLANQLMTDAFAKTFLNNESVEDVFNSTAQELRDRTKRD